MRIALGIGCVVIALAGCAGGSSPYVAEQGREIKALSADDTASLLAGKGMGLAKVAELNGYPGPAHVLELAPRLQLTQAQVANSQLLFDGMQKKAMALGAELVDAERDLDRLFASKAADAASLSVALARIGDLQARVRGAHLEAHLVQARILTPEQTARYIELRGYSGHQH